MKMTRDNWFQSLWTEYVKITPQAQSIMSLLKDRGERVRNDHIALRTFARSRVDLDRIAQSLQVLGYHSFADYRFDEKRLNARAFSAGFEYPKIFVSELRWWELSHRAQKMIRAIIEDTQVDDILEMIAEARRPWPLITLRDYQGLSQESEYAAWLCVMGLRANHFTVSVNDLRSFNSLEEVNQALQEKGFILNESGGLIKGSPPELLEQSSTLADQIQIDFSCGESLSVPSCYYEFALRYLDTHGQLFQGFVPSNANSIFESTDRI